MNWYGIYLGIGLVAGVFALRHLFLPGRKYDQPFAYRVAMFGITVFLWLPLLLYKVYYVNKH